MDMNLKSEINGTYCRHSTDTDDESNLKSKVEAITNRVKSAELPFLIAVNNKGLFCKMEKMYSKFFNYVDHLLLGAPVDVIHYHSQKGVHSIHFYNEDIELPKGAVEITHSVGNPDIYIGAKVFSILAACVQYRSGVKDLMNEKEAAVFNSLLGVIVNAI